MEAENDFGLVNFNKLTPRKHMNTLNCILY